MYFFSTELIPAFCYPPLTAFRGYSYCMKQAAKATALVLVISLLSGCSSSPKPADKPQAKTGCDEVTETYDNFTKVLSSQSNGSREYRLTYLIQNYYLLENTKCFTSVQVATARASIDFVNNLANLR